MLVERSMHESWLSNAFLLADEPGGTAVFVDSGAPLEPLLAAVERERVTPTHLLITHGHADHVAGNDELVERFSLEIVTGPLETGGLKIDALATPGHSDDGVSFVVGNLCFSGDAATIVVWSPDYDGKGKALVRFADGAEAIVGASRIEFG